MPAAIGPAGSVHCCALLPEHPVASARAPERLLVPARQRPVVTFASSSGRLSAPPSSQRIAPPREQATSSTVAAAGFGCARQLAPRRRVPSAAIVHFAAREPVHRPTYTLVPCVSRHRHLFSRTRPAGSAAV